MFFASACHAQNVFPLPTDTDLKAAYCTPILKANEESLASWMNSPFSASATNRKDMEAKAEEVSRSLRRVRLYLIPRLQYLDSHALLAASRSGEEDYAASIKAAEACISLCTAKGCQKCQENPAEARIKSCNSASFLPF